MPRLNSPDTAKLKTDAQKVVSTIRSNNAKTRAYCQLNILGGRMAEAAEKNDQKAEALFQKVDDLENQLGPEYRTLFDALYEVDPDSKDLQDIMSMFNTLDESLSALTATALSEQASPTRLVTTKVRGYKKMPPALRDAIAADAIFGALLLLRTLLS